MIPDDIRPLVEEVCVQKGLTRFDAKLVERWVRSDPQTWASCCLGGCDPCNDVIAAAARAVLEALESSKR